METHLKNLRHAIDTYRRLAAMAKAGCASWEGSTDGSYDQALWASGYMTYMKHIGELEELFAAIMMDGKS